MSSPEPDPQAHQEQQVSKVPQRVFHSIFAFPPNRETLGGTAYLIVENRSNILVDAPAWNDGNQNFLAGQGGLTWLVLTHRGGIGRAAQIQQTFGCQVLIQEQEAYLLPGVPVTTFRESFDLTPYSQMIWTPGHSPGSACLYHRAYGGVLFTGRHLLPNQQGQPVPLRTAKTFHWLRQLQSVEKLRQRFSRETLTYLCPGANTGFLRRERAIAEAYTHLSQLDLDALRQIPVTF